MLDINPEATTTQEDQCAGKEFVEVVSRMAPSEKLCLSVAVVLKTLTDVCVFACYVS